MEPQTVDLGNGCSKQVEYYDSGKIKREVYYLNGKFHREDGPAEIWYYDSGKIEKEVYYQQYAIQGKTLTKEDFENNIFSKKLSLI